MALTYIYSLSQDYLIPFPMTDSQILKFFEEGDWNTPCRFIVDHSDWPDMVIEHVTKNSGSVQDGKIIANETALKFCLNLRKGKYQKKGDLKGYYRGIGKKLWLHELRRRDRYGMHLEEYHRVASTQRAEELYPYHWKEEYDHVSVGLKKLHVTSRRVLKLVGEKWKYKEIAKKVGLSGRESVATTVKKARRRLATIINFITKFIILILSTPWL